MLKRLILIGGLMFCVPTIARAQEAVLCVNCSTMIEQLVAYAEQVLQYGLQIQQYENQITNTISLPSQLFANVTGDVNQVRGIINQANILTGNSSVLMQRLAAARMLGNTSQYLPINIANQYAMWQQTLANAEQSLGMSNQTQSEMHMQYATLQTEMQGFSTGAEGQKQAIQAQIDTMHIASTQLNQIQGTLTAAAQEAATRDIEQASRQQMYDIAVINSTTYATLPTAGQGW